jgi:hypothetical protein
MGIGIGRGEQAATHGVSSASRTPTSPEQRDDLQVARSLVFPFRGESASGPNVDGERSALDTTPMTMN